MNLDLEEAARRANCHPDTLAEKLRSGEAPGTKIGRAWVIPEELLQEWINARCHNTNEKAHRSSGYAGLSLAKSIASQRKQLTRQKRKSLKTPCEIDSGVKESSGTVVQFRFAKPRNDG